MKFLKYLKKLKLIAFSAKSDLVPEIDKDYIFDEKTTKSILMVLNSIKKF